jgi:translocator protein
MKNFLRLIISILIPLAAGFLGSIFTTSSVGSWYLTINKASFNPPGWIFAPVWTALYIMMGISFYFLWKSGQSAVRTKSIYLYFAQLLLNVLWSLLFFGLKNPLAAFIDILLLLATILYSVFLFYKISRISSYLFIPYLLWVSFASVLNLSIVILNP